jgi:peptide deformylase
MSLSNIKTYPAPILRKTAKKVESVTREERALLEDMAKIMYVSQGVGLAAVQIGIDKQLAVIDVGEGLVKFINPIIIKKDGCETQEEGCLSVPNTYVKVKRAKNVVLNYLDENGEARQIKAAGLFARAIQHEVDHLSGRLIIDYLNPIKRLFVRKRSHKRSQRLDKYRHI